MGDARQRGESQGVFIQGLKFGIVNDMLALNIHVFYENYPH